MLTKDIKTVRVSSFRELHDALTPFRSNARWMFRGHSDPEWLLVPKAGRPPFSVGGRDLGALSAWKRQAVGFMAKVPNNEWEWMAIAQHHGLATRLLDWTYHPLTAVWFALSGSADTDAVVYAYLTSYHWKPEEFPPKDCGTGIGRYTPPAVAARIARQGGVFTLHNPADRALEKNLNPGDQLEAIILDQGYREELAFEISHYGVNSLTLFPDLDGLSDHVNWLWSKRMYSDRSLLASDDSSGSSPDEGTGGALAS
jgi:hypothetical protein